MQIDTIEAATEARAAFTVDPAAIEAAAKFLAKRLIEPRSTIPILSHVMLAADIAGTVTLTGSDLDTWASVTLPAMVESPGAFCLDAAPLADALAKLVKGKARAVQVVDLGGNRAKVSGEGTRAAFTLRGLPADDFPLPPPTDGDTLSRFTVPAPRFLADLATLAPCQSKDETRYYLNGTALQVRRLGGRDRLVMVAIDGPNMAIASRPVPAGAEALTDSILHRKPVAILGHAAKLAPAADAVAIEAGPRIARFELGNVSITAKLIDGTFPAWESVFDAAMAPTDGAAAMFPELLPGAPVDAMDKCAKGAKAKLDWQPSRDGFLGTVPGDDGLLFACMALRDGAGPRKGYAYQWSGHGDAESYLLALIETRGLVSPAAMAERAEAVNAAFGDENDSWEYNGGCPYRARPWGRATFEGAQLIQRGSRIMGLTIGGEVETRSWKETVQDWEALCEREIHHAGGREALEGSYSIIMPADGPGALQAESEITGPDGVRYPVADNGNSIHLSKDQVRALIGDSCFETMPVTMPDGSSAFILQWLWEQGDSRFLTVKADGRTYPGAPYVTRAEIEAGPVEIEPEAVAEEAGAIECPEISSPEGAESDAEPVAAQGGAEPVEALSGPEIAQDAIVCESHNCAAPDPFADLAARVAALEAHLAALSADTVPAEAAPPIPVAQERPRRTAAHERMVRKAWAERQERRESERFWEAAYAEAKSEAAGAMIREAARTVELERATAKRRRAVMLARQRGREMATLAGVIRNQAEALELARRSPLYMNEAGRESGDHLGRAAHHARTAIDKAEGLERQLSSARAAVERQQEAIERLGDELVRENLRANRAETALAAVKARADGWPPAVQSVRLNFGGQGAIAA